MGLFNLTVNLIIPILGLVDWKGVWWPYDPIALADISKFEMCRMPYLPG